MPVPTDKVVLITGASSGIGAALAREYARRGARTVLVARRLERIRDLAHALGDDRSLALAADVTRDGDLERAVSEAVARFGRLDVAVANAGFGGEGRFDRLTVEDFRRQFDTNVLGVLRTAWAVLPQLERVQGTFAAVGSVAGYLPGKGTAAYAMSKAAVRSFCECMQVEWASRGVAGVHVAPGFVASEIRQVDGHGRLHEDAKDPVPSWVMLDAGRAARQIAAGIERRRPEVVVTLHGRLGAFLGRHAPGLVRTLFRVATR
jgi:NAD(P)-dependent dehydrogenase (short-subunit alcohol dehydrogenase family)